MAVRYALLALLLSVAAAPVPATQNLQVVPIIHDGNVLVSFKLEEALTEDIRAAIHSGMAVKLVYTIDLRRTASAWFDRTIASAVVTASVKYDTLTRRYQISRAVDGRIEWADSTDREDAAWAALTSDFARLSLFRGVPLEQNAEYYVRVRAHSTPRNAAFIWPWQADEAVGLAKFTFLR
jgi:hypothetical protein